MLRMSADMMAGLIRVGQDKVASVSVHVRNYNAKLDRQLVTLCPLDQDLDTNDIIIGFKLPGVIRHHYWCRAFIAKKRDVSLSSAPSGPCSTGSPPDSPPSTDVGESGDDGSSIGTDACAHASVSTRIGVSRGLPRLKRGVHESQQSDLFRCGWPLAEGIAPEFYNSEHSSFKTRLHPRNRARLEKLVIIGHNPKFTSELIPSPSAQGGGGPPGEMVGEVLSCYESLSPPHLPPEDHHDPAS
jgi:hypothetical protein